MNKLSLLLLPVLCSAITLSEVVQETIKTNPGVNVQKEESYAQKEGLSKVRAGYFPKLDVSYSVGPEVTTTIANQQKRAELTRQNASATLSQNIFEGFNTMYSMDEQKSLVISADESLADTVNEISLEMIRAYIDVLRYKALLKTSKDNVALHTKYLAQVKEKVDAGVGISSDYEQTKSRYENVKSLEFLANLNYENAVSNFRRLLATDVDLNTLVEPVLGELPAQNADELVALAMQNNPLVLSTKAQRDSAEASMDKSNAPYYPSVDIKAEAYWNDNVHGVGVVPEASAKDTEDSGYNALLVVNYNLFNGLADSSTKQFYRHRLLKQESKLQDIQRSVKHQTISSWNTFYISGQSIVHIDRHIAATKKTVSDYQQENDLGRRSIIDLLNISVEYNNALDRKITTNYDRMVAYYEVLAYTGKLLDEMSVVAK